MAWIEKTPFGTYRVVSRDKAGRRHKSETFKRRKDAVAERIRIEGDASRGVHRDAKTSRVTLAGWWEEWRENAERLCVANDKPSRSTLAKYDGLWRLYVSTLGSRRLDAITRGDVQDFVLEVADKAGAFRADDAFKLLRMLLNKARSRDLIVRDVCEFVDVPTPKRKTPRVLTPDEIEKLADAIGERWRALVFLAAYSSLRFSEILGLRVSRVDFLRRRLIVEEKVIEVNGHRHVGAPKTDASRRVVDLPALVVEELAEHLRRLPAGPDDYVFRTVTGKPILRAPFYRLTWWPALKRAGLEGFKLKDLRHTGNTLGLIETGDYKAAQARLGHSSSKLTIDTYQVLVDSQGQRFADALERVAREARAATRGRQTEAR